MRNRGKRKSKKRSRQALTLPLVFSRLTSTYSVITDKTLIYWFMVFPCGVEMEIGQKVRVRRLRDRSPKEVIARLGKTGVIKEFKMVDGSGVGIVVRFEDNFATWFFEDELEPA